MHELAAGQQTQTNCRYLYLTHTTHGSWAFSFFSSPLSKHVKTLTTDSSQGVIVSLRYVSQTSQCAIRRVCISSVAHVLSVTQDLRLSSESSVSQFQSSGCGNMTGRQRIGRNTSNSLLRVVERSSSSIPIYIQSCNTYIALHSFTLLGGRLGQSVF